MAFRKSRKLHKELEERRLAEEIRQHLYLDMPIPGKLSPSVIVNELQQPALEKKDLTDDHTSGFEKEVVIFAPPTAPAHAAYQKRQKITSLIACAACVALCIGIGLPTLLAQKGLKNNAVSDTAAGEIGGSGHFSPENDSEKESFVRDETVTTSTFSKEPLPSPSSSTLKTESVASSDFNSADSESDSSFTSSSSSTSSTTSVSPDGSSDALAPPTGESYVDSSQGNSIITSSNTNANSSSQPAMQIYRINADNVRLKTAQGILLIDVRGADEYALKHIPNAVNIPLPYLNDSIEDYASPPDGVIVYCETGVRSAEAAEMLALKGYIVYNLGGISTDWPYDTVEEPASSLQSRDG